MSDLLSAARAVAQLAQERITDVAQLPTMEEAFQSEPRFGALMGRLSGASQAQTNAVLDILTPAINTADPYQGNRMAIVCGTLVEQGGDAARVAPALVQRLPSQLALAARVLPFGDDFALAQIFAQEPDGLKAWEGLRFLLLASMTALCRDMPARIQARQSRGIVNALPPLTEYFAEADFLSQLLGYTDGMEIIVLHVAEHKGWRVRLEAVHTNFHLFTLLQARLVGNPSQGLLAGEPTAPDIRAVARGEAPPTGTQSDFARFHFYTADALQPDGSLDRNTGGWVWGEGKPDDILPRLDGSPVLLLGPPLFGSRSWDTGFFANIHDALRSDVTITETLTDAQVTEWLSRIIAARLGTTG